MREGNSNPQGGGLETAGKREEPQRQSQWTLWLDSWNRHLTRGCSMIGSPIPKNGSLPRFDLNGRYPVVEGFSFATPGTFSTVAATEMPSDCTANPIAFYRCGCRCKGICVFKHSAQIHIHVNSWQHVEHTDTASQAMLRDGSKLTLHVSPPTTGQTLHMQQERNFFKWRPEKPHLTPENRLFRRICG